MKITSEPVYEETSDGKVKIGIPDDWEKFYECGVPNGPCRYGAYSPSSGVCYAVFRYESELRKHLLFHHRVNMNRRHLSQHMVEVNKHQD